MGKRQCNTHLIFQITSKKKPFRKFDICVLVLPQSVSDSPHFHPKWHPHPWLSTLQRPPSLSPPAPEGAAGPGLAHLRHPHGLPRLPRVWSRAGSSFQRLPVFGTSSPAERVGRPPRPSPSGEVCSSSARYLMGGFTFFPYLPSITTEEPPGGGGDDWMRIWEIITCFLLGCIAGRCGWVIGRIRQGNRDGSTAEAMYEPLTSAFV